MSDRRKPLLHVAHSSSWSLRKHRITGQQISWTMLLCWWSDISYRVLIEFRHLLGLRRLLSRRPFSFFDDTRKLGTLINSREGLNLNRSLNALVSDLLDFLLLNNLFESTTRALASDPFFNFFVWLGASPFLFQSLLVSSPIFAGNAKPRQLRLSNDPIADWHETSSFHGSKSHTFAARSTVLYNHIDSIALNNLHFSLSNGLFHHRR